MIFDFANVYFSHCSGVVGLIGNLFTLIILSSSATLRHKPFNMILISQSILDAINSAITIATAWDIVFLQTPGHTGIAGKEHFHASQSNLAIQVSRVTISFSGILKCYLWDSKHQLWTFLICSTWNLVVLNIERWISILHPSTSIFSDILTRFMTTNVNIVLRSTETHPPSLW